jgi:hypothetical protein
MRDASHRYAVEAKTGDGNVVHVLNPETHGVTFESHSSAARTAETIGKLLEHSARVSVVTVTMH